MTDHVYKSIELTGSSQTNIDDAINNAISKASRSIHNMRWFQVSEIRGGIDAGSVKYWQVTVKVGFTLDD